MDAGGFENRHHDAERARDVEADVGNSVVGHSENCGKHELLRHFRAAHFRQKLQGDKNNTGCYQSDIKK